MDIEREHKIEQLCTQAMELPEADVDTWLAEMCAGEPELADDVKDMLMWMERDDSLSVLETVPLVDESPTTPLSKRKHRPSWQGGVPKRIGPFRILKELGEGGMGKVFLAKQAAPVKRKVALKLMRSSISQTLDAAYAELESRAMAQLSHPNIATIYEVGDTPMGHHYLAIEYVDGPSLLDYCNNKRLNLPQRIALMRQVCRGVQHAHQKGIIHRDLKPSNILVTEIDGKPLAKIIDFGIAKDLRTVTGQPLSEDLVGTPIYMCPEMVERGPNRTDLDTRVDVYALGIVMFELIAGMRPIDTHHMSVAQILDRITKAPWPKISERLAASPNQCRMAAFVRGYSARSFVRHIKRDLDWIVARAGAALRDERYPTVDQLNADLYRYLHQKNVLATPKTPYYLLGNLVRRHYLSIAMTTLVLLLLAGGIAGRSIEYQRAQEEAERARTALHEARQVSKFLTDIFQEIGPRRTLGKDVDVSELLDASVRKAQQDLENFPMVRVRLLLTVAQIQSNLGNSENMNRYLVEAKQLLEGRRDSLELAEVLAALSTPEIERGNWALARDYLNQALAIQQKQLGELGSQTLSTLSSLAHLDWAEGRHQQAITAFRDLLEKMRKADGAESLAVGKQMVWLGRDYMYLGNYPEAETNIRRGIPIIEKNLPDKHPNTLMAWTQLGRVLRKRGDFEGAQNILERVVRDRIEIHGPENAVTANAHFFLGQVYLDQDKIEAGTHQLTRALAIWRETKGEKHRNMGWGATEMGRALIDAKRYDEAEVSLNRALEVYDNLYGPNHFHAAAGYHQLGRLNLARNNPALAETHFRRALAILENTMPADHPERIRNLNSLGEIFLERDQREQAREVLGQARLLCRRKLPPRHPIAMENNGLIQKLDAKKPGD